MAIQTSGGTVRVDPPHAGLTRTMYFLAAAVVAIFVVLSGVLGLYRPPDSGIDLSSGFFDGGTIVAPGQVEVDSTADEFADAVEDGAVFSVTVTDDEIRWDNFSNSNVYVIPLEAGETLDSILAGAGLDRSDITFITDETTQGSSTEQQVSSGSGDDYNRNITIILGLISALLFAVAIIALPESFNPLRAALLASGLIVFLVSMGFWSGADEDWLGVMMSALNFATLAGLLPFLEHGLPPEFRRPTLPPPPEAVA